MMTMTCLTGEAVGMSRAASRSAACPSEPIVAQKAPANDPSRERRRTGFDDMPVFPGFSGRLSAASYRSLMKQMCRLISWLFPKMFPTCRANCYDQGQKCNNSNRLPNEPLFARPRLQEYL